LFIAALAGSTFTTTYPGIHHPAITNLNALGIRPYRHHLTKDLMTQDLTFAGHVQLLTTTEIKHTLMDVNI
jgi:hypothetical protein